MNILANLSLPLPANILVFILATALVWFSGTRMVIYGDELAERFGLSREFIGLFFLAIATELPEIVTTITAARSGNAPLVLGNMFGGVTMQTAILALVDLFFVHRALTSWPRKPTHALEAVFLIIFLNVLLVVTILGDFQISPALGLGSVALFVGYPLSIAILKRYDQRSTWAPIDIPDESEQKGAFIGGRTLENWSTRKLVRQTIIAAGLILIAGYATATSAEMIAKQTGLSAS
ncbi:MAG: sodium:calcium antiporter, partial [Boseongicola sp.]